MAFMLATIMYGIVLSLYAVAVDMCRRIHPLGWYRIVLLVIFTIVVIIATLAYLSILDDFEEI